MDQFQQAVVWIAEKWPIVPRWDPYSSFRTKTTVRVAHSLALQERENPRRTVGPSITLAGSEVPRPSAPCRTKAGSQRSAAACARNSLSWRRPPSEAPDIEILAAFGWRISQRIGNSASPLGDGLVVDAHRLADFAIARAIRRKPTSRRATMRRYARRGARPAGDDAQTRIIIILPGNPASTTLKDPC